MAIKIVSKFQHTDATEVIEAGTAVSDFADRIDKIGGIMGDIEKIMDKIPQKDREKLPELQKLLTAELKDFQELMTVHHADDDPDIEYTELGVGFQALVGKAGNERKIKTEVEVDEDGKNVTLPGVRVAQHLLGDEVFYKVCKVNLKDLDDYLTPTQRDTILDKRRTKRPVVVEKRVLKPKK